LAPNGYLKQKLLRLQLGYLLAEGPGSARVIPLELPQLLQIDHDLYLESLTGSLTLTRTKDGILVQGQLQAVHARECDRCLEPFEHAFILNLAELFSSPPDASKSVFSISSSGEVDLAPLLREEILIEASFRAVCDTNCPGLSAETGLKLESAPSPAPADPSIDPRMAVLQQYFD